MILGSTPLLDADAALAALDAAVRAYDHGQGLWPNLRVAERIQHVERFLARMREQREAVVKLLMWEIGKNLKDSEKEFDRTCDYIVDTIEALKELDRRSSRFELEQGTLGQIRRVPLGVALCMGPYNYPLNETFTTLIPALIMGNTVVFKPAKFGVLLIRPLLEAFRDSFPPGVINVIYGRGRETVSALMASGKVDVFAFIGTHSGASDLKKLHPRPAPPARRPRPGREEPGYRPAAGRPGQRGERGGHRRAVLQRPALHRAEDPVQSTKACCDRSSTSSARAWPASSRACRGNREWR